MIVIFFTKEPKIIQNLILFHMGLFILGLTDGTVLVNEENGVELYSTQSRKEGFKISFLIKLAVGAGSESLSPPLPLMSHHQHMLPTPRLHLRLCAFTSRRLWAWPNVNRTNRGLGYHEDNEQERQVNEHFSAQRLCTGCINYPRVQGCREGLWASLAMTSFNCLLTWTLSVTQQISYDLAARRFEQSKSHSTFRQFVFRL